jgi:hypothetical protein
MPEEAKPSQVDYGSRIAQELDSERARVRKLREELRVAEALVSRLERLMDPAPNPARVAVNPEVLRRRDAMIEILANGGPLGPSEILAELENLLGKDVAGGRHKVTDLLRRDGAFVNEARGQWTLSPGVRKQLGNEKDEPSNGKPAASTEEPKTEDYDFEDIPF